MRTGQDKKDAWMQMEDCEVQQLARPVRALCRCVEGPVTALELVVCCGLWPVACAVRGGKE